MVLCTALCLQALACGLIRWRLGQSWLTRPVGILVVTAVAYHGLSELLLAIPSIRIWDVGRLGIGQAYIDKAALVISFGLLALVVGYLLTRPEQASVPNSRDCTPVIRALDWRPFAVAPAPRLFSLMRGEATTAPLRRARRPCRWTWRPPSWWYWWYLQYSGSWGGME